MDQLVYVVETDEGEAVAMIVCPPGDVRDFLDARLRGDFRIRRLKTPDEIDEVYRPDMEFFIHESCDPQ